MDFVNDIAKSMISAFSALDSLSQNALLVVSAVLVGLVIIMVLARSGRRPKPEGPDVEGYEHSMAPPVPPSPPEPEYRGPVVIAEMVEKTQLSGFGGLCVALMVLTWIISIVTFLTAPTANQQIVALLIWIGGNTMFGVAALLQQEKRYTIHKG